MQYSYIASPSLRTNAALQGRLCIRRTKLHIDQHTKELQKAYCRTLLTEHSQLTKELFDRINAGDEETMRCVYTDQQQKIRQQAETIENSIEKQITLTQADSIQEVLDALPNILNS